MLHRHCKKKHIFSLFWKVSVFSCDRHHTKSSTTEDNECFNAEVNITYHRQNKLSYLRMTSLYSRGTIVPRDGDFLVLREVFLMEPLTNSGNGETEPYARKLRRPLKNVIGGKQSRGPTLIGCLVLIQSGASHESSVSLSTAR